MASVPKALSPGEEAFANHCKFEKLSPVREYPFHPTRKWRFDFAFPDSKIAVEIEGAIWTLGRHSRGKGIAEDMVKYNEATLLGWRVLRYSTEMVMAGTAIDQVLALLKSKT